MDSQQLQIMRENFLKKHWIETDKADESQMTTLLSVMSVPNRAGYEKKQADFSFLERTPFTEKMIKEGLRKWKQPFDEHDFKQIETGELSPGDAVQYLYWWTNNNRDRYNELKSIAC